MRRWRLGGCAVCVFLQVGCRPITARMAARLEDPRAPVVTVGASEVADLQAELAALPEPRRSVVARALQRLGEPAAGIDCSSFTRSVFQEAGVDLPRSVREQYGAGTPIGRDEMLPGDLLFFAFARSPADHVGVYAGSGAFLHVSSAAARVQLASLTDPAFAAAYVGPRRVVAATAPAP